MSPQEIIITTTSTNARANQIHPSPIHKSHNNDHLGGGHLDIPSPIHTSPSVQRPALSSSVSDFTSETTQRQRPALTSSVSDLFVKLADMSRYPNSFPSPNNNNSNNNNGGNSGTQTFWRWRRPNFNIGNNRPKSSDSTQGGSGADSANNNDIMNAPPTGSAAEALCSMFGDEELSDVRLRGSDGGTVVAVKAILAARSPLFRQRLYCSANKTINNNVSRPSSSSTSDGKPSSGKGDDPTAQTNDSSSRPSSSTSIKQLEMYKGKQVVDFKEFDCRILHMVVEFCYTDTMSLMKVPANEDIARLMANLRIASKAFKLPFLLDKVNQWSWRQLNRNPALSCAMIDEGMKMDDIDELALQTLQLKTRAALLPTVGAVGTGVLAFSKPGLLFALRSLEDTTSHLLLFQSIQRWVEFSHEETSTSPARDRASREAFARKCAMRFIKLSKISPGNLESVMKNSTLFTGQKDITKSTLLLDAGIRFSDRHQDLVSPLSSPRTSPLPRTRTPTNATLLSSPLRATSPSMQSQ